MKPLTDTTPKPLAKVNGKTLLEYNLEPLINISDEFVIVIGWLGDQIREFVGDSFHGVPVTYAVQENITGGTLDSFRRGLRAANTDASGYIAANSDNILGPKLYDAFGHGVASDPTKVVALAHTVEDREKLKTLGVFETTQDDRFVAIHEKPQEFISDQANVGLYYFPQSVANRVEDVITPPDQKEEYIIDLITIAKDEPGVQIVSEHDSFVAISTVEDLSLK
jgi:bifunctional UDP-N-acetylglucosamine pyrophosphorylase/glucosamine-1-phosphate N-acetyltransferase